MVVLLADDHPIFRGAIRQLIAEEYPGSQFVEATTVPETLACLISKRWSVIVLDLNMPGGSGLDVLRETRKLPQPVPVIVLSVQAEEQYAIRCFRAGASGFVNKAAAPEELMTAIRTVASGKRYVSPKSAERLAGEIAAPDTGLPHDGLSDRELDVLKMLARGESLTSIAHEFSVSVKTVSTYRTRILGKMRMSTNADLVRYALERSLIM